MANTFCAMVPRQTVEIERVVCVCGGGGGGGYSSQAILGSLDGWRSGHDGSLL
jgi:hypothetical protein